MRDNALIQVFRPLIVAGFAAQAAVETDAGVKAAMQSLGVAQNYQPTQQGRVSTPMIYFSKIIDHRHGSPGYVFNAEAGTRTKTEIIEGHWQINALCVEDPANDNELTAADYLKLCASIMQDVSFIDALFVHDVQVLRVQGIRTTYVQNDRDQFEKNPSFDVIITHKDITVTSVPIARRFNSGIHRV